MSAPPYMRLYVADYLADTTHLTTVEHGAYNLLLMAMWRAGGKLPRNDDKLAKIAKCSPDQWVEISDGVMEFFQVSGGAITHKRLTKEMSHYENVVEKRKSASKAGVSAKANKNSDEALPNGQPNANHLVAKLKPELELKEEREKKDSNESLEKDLFDGNPSHPSLIAMTAKPSRSSRLPPDWRPTETDLNAALHEGLDMQETQREADKFRDFWIAKSGAGGTKLDWPATWRNWARTAGDRKREALARRQNSGGGGQGVTDFAAIVARRRAERGD